VCSFDKLIFTLLSLEKLASFPCYQAHRARRSLQPVFILQLVTLEWNQIEHLYWLRSQPADFYPARELNIQRIKIFQQIPDSI